MHSPEQEFDPQKIIALVVVGVALIIVLIRRFRASAPPDPWSSEIDQAVKARDAIPVCSNCLYPQAGHRWFCPHCAFPTGDYVTSMPYLQIFAIGEVLRRGVIGLPERGFARKAFFVIFSASEYLAFAPIYWFWMVRKAHGKPICQARRDELKFEEIS